MAQDRHAISGYAFIIHGGAVAWSAKRQNIISLSTTESEYVAVTHAAKEALWLRSLIKQLFDDELSATTLFSDNQSAIALTKDHQYHARTKHIDVRYHFIRWIVEKGAV
jgi:predicted acetyltransferase